MALGYATAAAGNLHLLDIMNIIDGPDVDAMG
jgi:hypothetical protein